jgi:hypothetical protein
MWLRFGYGPQHVVSPAPAANVTLSAGDSWASSRELMRLVSGGGRGLVSGLHADLAPLHLGDPGPR